MREGPLDLGSKECAVAENSPQEGALGLMGSKLYIYIYIYGYMYIYVYIYIYIYIYCYILSNSKAFQKEAGEIC